MEPALVWLFVGERPLPTTVVWGLLLIVILAFHEVVANIGDLSHPEAIGEVEDSPRLSLIHI
eukprot:3885573-Amphidinium_carterae.1